jgi:hypothetical protein
VTLQIVGEVTPLFAFDVPSNPFFNLKVSGDKAVRMTVKSSQPSFEV